MVVIAVALPISHLRVAGEKRQYSGGGVQYYTDSSTDLHLKWPQLPILKYFRSAQCPSAGLFRFQCPLCCLQHFILEGKDGVWDGTEIS